MKAILWTAYGPPGVLQPGEVEKPVPRENEVLVRVHASTVTTGDCEMRRLQLPLFFSFPMRLYAGFHKPTRIRILGQELAGEVEATGKEVKQFKPGDPVFGTTGFHLGAYAEYTCLPVERGLAIKPANLTYQEAAAVPVGGLEALYFIRQGHIRRVTGLTRRFLLAVYPACWLADDVVGDHACALHVLASIRRRNPPLAMGAPAPA